MKLRTREYDSSSFRTPAPRNTKIKHNKIDYIVARCYKSLNSEYNYLVKWVNNNSLVWYTESELFLFKSILREYNDRRDLLPKATCLQQYVYDFKYKRESFTLQELVLYVQGCVRYGNEHPNTYSEKLKFILHDMYKIGEIYHEQRENDTDKWIFPKISYKSENVLKSQVHVDHVQHNTTISRPKSWSELRKDIMEIRINGYAITNSQKELWYEKYPNKTLNELDFLANVATLQRTLTGKKTSILHSDRLILAR